MNLLKLFIICKFFFTSWSTYDTLTLVLVIEKRKSKYCLFTASWSFVGSLQAGVNVKVVLTLLNSAFLPIPQSRFKQHQIPMLISLTTVCRFCVNFWGIFVYFGKEEFFWKDRANWGKPEMLKIWWIWKIEIWIEN